MSLTDFTTPRFDVLEEIGVVELPRTGRIIKVRVMDAPDGTGAALDVREFMLTSSGIASAKPRLERC